MKGLIAFIVGVALTAISVTVPRVIADENGEVHYWTTSSAYVPSDETVNCVSSDGTTMVRTSNRMIYTGIPVASGARVYFVSDDPTYDLSGSADQLVLVGDGTAIHETSGHTSAAFARAGATPHEVVPIAAEYRQDWLAVSAGDRPVRTFTAPRSVMDTGAMAMVPSRVEEVRASVPDNDEDRYTTTRDTFRPVHHPRRRMYRHRRAHSAQLSAAWRHQRRKRMASYASTAEREDEPAMTTRMSQPAVAMTESAVEIKHDEMGHELFQINNSWYMKNNGDWFRSESWRGPFVHVKKGTVPREVRMSEKHPSRMDQD